jgi:hypothetical protein
LIFLMQFLTTQGPFCRRCGLAIFRRMTADTMWQGWWGLASFFITPITVLINFVLRAGVAKLPEPQPFPYGPSGIPLDPGRPLLARPGAIFGSVILLGVLVAFIAAIVRSF